MLSCEDKPLTERNPIHESCAVCLEEVLLLEELDLDNLPRNFPMPTSFKHEITHGHKRFCVGVSTGGLPAFAVKGTYRVEATVSGRTPNALKYHDVGMRRTRVRVPITKKCSDDEVCHVEERNMPSLDNA
jgi:hypothetical protein